MDKQRWLARIIIYYLVILTVLRIGLGPFAWCFPQSVFFADVTSSALIDLVNQSRLENDLPAVQLNAQLNLAAYKKAQDMLEKQYFDHCSPDGLDPWHWFDQAGYQYQYAGENLAIHFFDSAEVHQAWMGSSSHRDNILNPLYREMGLAVLQGEFDGHPTAVVVQLFGTPYQIAYTETRLQPVSLPTPEPQILPEYQETTRELVGDIDLENVSQLEEVTEVETGLEEIEVASVSPESDLTDFYPEQDWRLLGAASISVTEIPQGFWFKFFKFISRSYESFMQQLIFYGVILIAIYLIIAIIGRSQQPVAPVYRWTTLVAMFLIILTLLSKSLIWQWMAGPLIIG